MRRANFSIGRFFPTVAITNTAGFFQSFRFHAVGVKNYRNELAELAKLPYQEWESSGLDPVKFVQDINIQRFYCGDGFQLLKLLKECCWMLIQHDATEMEPADKAVVTDYAYKVINSITAELLYGSDCVSWSGPGGDEFGYVESIGDEILAKFTAEKKEGPTVEMFKTINKLYSYVLTLNPLNLEDSSPAETQPRHK